ncbi:hypothetical protein Lfu02_51450 [Longispora fulva]|uniref:Arc/MetJ-type ribon-helix-helix transcriptional regulator n=1 Tax=Longispora fulva TaxID=619741 RepID=A0A8J7KP53_9ACTN|nr:type II toxin-antitoxin system ParD family antitoxin [Longispora fulva]MBG6140961.1 Arc/MetJ-type ribon-helix-helix transcriptional regulator [Longispora fulva]GIG60773.1 hypothetical protein Lfu02_51450 [Longispora fulva]
MSAVGGTNSVDGGGVPVELARHYRQLADDLVAQGRFTEAADTLRAGLLAVEERIGRRPA